MVSVLVVEDSTVACELLVHILNSDPDINVLGTARDGASALEFLARQKPDVITMDINMPHMDGFETTRRIMETQPVPIVIVSANLQSEQTAQAFRALEAGALDTIEKPRGPGHPDHAALSARLVQSVKAMAAVKVIKRWPRTSETPVKAFHRPLPASTAVPKLVVIGASTGGPPVLQTILSALPKDFPVPILIVQHIAAGFTQSMVDWLQQSTGFAVSIGAHGQELHSAHAYFAPDHHHIGVDQRLRIVLSGTEKENGLRPSVSYLFRSAQAVLGANCIGVLLTGMGRDGAQELRALKDGGAVTLAQDAPSSIVHGMPGEAIKLNGATYVLPPPRIASMLQSLVCKRA